MESRGHRDAGAAPNLVLDIVSLLVGAGVENSVEVEAQQSNSNKGRGPLSEHRAVRDAEYMP